MRPGLWVLVVVCVMGAGLKGARAADDAPFRAVRGRVVDADAVASGQEGGIAGAIVAVVGRETRVTTDERGAFVIAIPHGDSVLKVTAAHYNTAQFEVPATCDADLGTIVLAWSAADASRTVVEAGRPPPTSSTTRLSRRDIDAAPHRNAEEILRQVPGLTLVQHGSEGKGHQFFLRGFDAIHGADLALSVDQIPINEWSNVHAQGYLDLAFMLPEFVSDVTVVKGPFTLDDGAFAMAGSGAWHLGVDPRDAGLRATYTAGTTGRHRLFVGYAPEHGDGQQFVGVAATHDDGFGARRALDRLAANARVHLHDAGDKGRLTLTGLGAVSRFALPGTLRNDDVEDGRVGFYGAYDPANRGESGRAVLSLRYTRDVARHTVAVAAWGGWRGLFLRENFTGFLVDPEHGDRREQTQTTWSYGLDGRATWRVTPDLAVITRLGARGDVLAQREVHVGQALEPLATRRSLEAHQLLAHGALGLSWRPLRRLTVDAGARVSLVHVDVSDRLDEGAGGANTLPVVSPRLNVHWRPRAAIALTAAYGRGVRPPEARAFSGFKPSRTGIGDDIYMGGEPRATVSDAVELGVMWRPIPRVTLSAAGFATFIERESVFDHVSGVNLELNGTRRVGAELVIAVEPTDWLRLAVDATAVDARFVASSNPVPFAPSLVAGLRTDVAHPSGLHAGLRVLVVAPRPLPHGARGATLVMTDLVVGYRWEWLQLNLAIENLLDRQIREGEYHYASHWQLDRPVSELPVIHTTAGAPLNVRLTLGVTF